MTRFILLPIIIFLTVAALMYGMIATDQDRDSMRHSTKQWKQARFLCHVEGK